MQPWAFDDMEIGNGVVRNGVKARYRRSGALRSP